MEYAILKDGHVENVVLFDPDNIPNWVNQDEIVQLNGRAVSIGDSYDGSDFHQLPPSDDFIAFQVRDTRDKLLQELDAIVSNPLRWAALTTEQQQAWADYRQALLDIPSQSGFPHDIVWPNKPE